jgi:hypothetical protein
VKATPRAARDRITGRRRPSNGKAGRAPGPNGDLNWEAVARSQTHPTQLAILEALGRRGESSPGQLANSLGVSIALAAYHVQMLQRAGLIVATRTIPVRGALAHFYKLAPGMERAAKKPNPAPHPSAERQPLACLPSAELPVLRSSSDDCPG